MRKILTFAVFSILTVGMIFPEGNESGSMMNGAGISPSFAISPNGIFLQEIPVNRYGYRQVSSDQLKRMLENKNFDLINVHIPYQGEIPKTDANIAFNRINDIMEQYPRKDALIVLYCMSGPMSQYASRELVKSGYTNIVELAGGSNAWKRSGNDLIIKSR